MLEGSIVALVTPFDENNNVNYIKIKEIVKHQITKGTKAILILGTTSEASTLSEKEQEQVVKIVSETNNGIMKIVVGLCYNDTNKSLYRAKIYEKYNIDYFLVITPFYNKTNESGLIKHFKIIADNVACPVILYNIPGRTGVNISIEQLKLLSKHKNICGIKEASRDINQIIEEAFICDDNFSLYCGNDDLIFLFTLLNARGAFNVYGNIDPGTMNKLAKETDFVLYRKYYPILRKIFSETNPIPIKALMNYLGCEVGECRLPLDKMNESLKDDLINEYKKLNN